MLDMWTPEKESTQESLIIGYNQLLWKSIGLREQILMIIAKQKTEPLHQKFVVPVGILWFCTPDWTQLIS